jgi:hypothetical protein
MKKITSVSVLPDILHALFDKNDMVQTMRQYAVWDCWDDVVGPTIAHKAQPEGIRNGILFVTVTSSVWMQELSFMKDMILEKLNKKMDTSMINDLRFKIGKIPIPPHADGATALPPLENEDLAKIEQATSSIQDQEIRHSLQNLFAASVRKKKQS